MKIRTRLKIIMLFSISAVIIVAGILSFESVKEDREKHEAAIADEIAKNMSELRYLAFEYMIQGRERQKRQFQIKYDSIALLIRAEVFSFPEEKAALDTIQNNYKVLGALFPQIVANRERPGVSREGGAVAHDLETRLIGLFLFKSQEIVNDAFSLAKMIRNEERSTHERLQQLIIISTLLIAVMILMSSLLLIRSIGTPIAKLYKGTEIIGAGRLDYKVGTDTKDEIGELSRAFDSMTENLAKVMASRDELNREMEERRRAEEKLQESERKYRKLVENSLVGIYKSNLSGDIFYANDALTGMLEFGSPDELISTGVIARYKNPKDRETLIEDLRKTGRIEDFETELITKTGKTINVLLSAVHDNDILSGMVMDITARKRDEEQLLKNHRELSALYGISSAISRTIDMDTLLNNILKTITGLDILDVEQKAGIFIIEGEKMELVSHLGHTELFLNSHKDMKVGDCLCGIAAKTGEIIISHDSGKDDRHTFRYPDMTPHGHIILPLKAKEKVVGVLYLYLPADAELNDEKMKMLITVGDQIGMAIDHARLYEETKALSLHDQLTGLSNRHFFDKIIEREIATVKRKDETMSFIMIDLDHFKEINDTLGHLTGDRILVETANLIRNTVRKADLVFRLGGDEFLVLLTNADCDKTTNMVARLLDEVEIWNRNNADTFGCKISFSLGCAACDKECDVQTAIKEADERMYQNKKEKKNNDGR